MTISPTTSETCCEPVGFNLRPFSTNNRLQVVTLVEETIAAFKEAVKEFSVQALEYKPFLRFAIAEALDKISKHTLGASLLDILHDRSTGAFLLQYDGTSAKAADETAVGDFHVQLSTAVAHLIGLANFDSMDNRYYARFTVRNQDDSDSYLRQAHRRLELHNDGTYVNERTDLVLMMKMIEENIDGGDSLLLHLDDWQDLTKFYNHPLAKQDIQWGAPASKNIDYKTYHPVFFEEDASGQPYMLYIDQFAEPQNREQGLYLYELGKSLEADERCFNVPLPVGSMLVIHNHIWLHGRDKFIAHENLRRELLRLRGHFTK